MQRSGEGPRRREGCPQGGQSQLGWDSPVWLETHIAISHRWGFWMTRLSKAPGLCQSFLWGTYVLPGCVFGLRHHAKSPQALFLLHPYPSLLYLSCAEPRHFCWMKLAVFQDVVLYEGWTICYRIFVFSPNSYIEMWTYSVMVFGGEACEKWLGHEGMFGFVSLQETPESSLP